MSQPMHSGQPLLNAPILSPQQQYPLAAAGQGFGVPFTQAGLSPNNYNPAPYVAAPATHSGNVTPVQLGRVTPMSANGSIISNAPAPAGGCANVFVASLPNFYDDKMLMELFQPFGAIVSAKVSRDLVTGNSRSFGFVRFQHAESAHRAIADLHNAKVKGAGTSKLHVTLSSHNENQSAAECDRLYVRNLPTNATTESLIAIFSPHGTVLEANIHGNSQQPLQAQGAPRGGANMAVGFVRMASVEEARAAMERVHNTRPFDPDSPILVRFMETPDMKAARRGRQRDKDSEGGSGRTSVNRNSPDHLAVSSSSQPSPGPYGPAPVQQLTPTQYAVHPPAANQQRAFPTYGDLYMQGAASEAIVRFIFAHAGYTVAMCVGNSVAHFVRLADTLQHERAASELNNVVLSDGNTIKLVTLLPPAQAAPPPMPLSMHAAPMGMQQQQPMAMPMASPSPPMSHGVTPPMMPHMPMHHGHGGGMGLGTMQTSPMGGMQMMGNQHMGGMGMSPMGMPLGMAQPAQIHVGMNMGMAQQPMQ